MGADQDSKDYIRFFLFVFLRILLCCVACDEVCGVFMTPERGVQMIRHQLKEYIQRGLTDAILTCDDAPVTPCTLLLTCDRHAARKTHSAIELAGSCCAFRHLSCQTPDLLRAFRVANLRVRRWVGCRRLC